MAKTEIRSVRDLPFPELDRFTLLHLSPDRVDADLDNYGFGYGRLDAIALVEHAGDQRTRVVRDALVLALHAWDNAEPDAHDIELSFWLDDDEYYEEEDPDDDNLVVLAPLRLFLRKRLPELVADFNARAARAGAPPIADVVLALCNPFRAVIERPPGLVTPPIYYPIGNATSRMESDRAREVWDPDATLCLDAEEWLRLP
ncbi:MAG: hypothetical protein H6713_03185 [Myxococcales bacterium]|nr:hypothetical protein [Myxococcales bacterium]MCB9748993.1 hypothetical protein [Myxococcales bacterium]